jgi:hypothetical protein
MTEQKKSKEIVQKTSNNSKSELSAKRYMKQGYRRVSRKFCQLSRIDREDWKEHMAKIHIPWNFEKGMNWVKCLERQPGSAEDHYRRCYSEDIITVDKAISDKVKTSNWDSISYVER